MYDINQRLLLVDCFAAYCDFVQRS